jgi:hypothetical protein
MEKKIPLPVVIALLVCAIAAVVGSIMYYRKANGADIVDQMHATMAKAKSGQAPFTPEQMQQMRSQGRGPGSLSH